MPEESAIAQLTIDTVKVEKLVREYLTAQNLTILPQNLFGDAVSQFVDKDDKHAMDLFVTENLGKQVQNLVKEGNIVDEEEIMDRLGQHRSHLEELFNAGHLKNSKKARMKPKPDHWDSDLDGSWEEQPGAFVISGDDQDDDDAENGEDGSVPPRTNAAARGRGKANGAATRKAAAPSQRAAPKGRGGTAKNGARGSKKVVDEDEDDDDDSIMLDDDNFEQETAALIQKPTKSTARATTKRGASPVKKTPARATKASQAAGKQGKLNFSQSASQARPTNGRSQARPVELVSLRMHIL